MKCFPLNLKQTLKIKKSYYMIIEIVTKYKYTACAFNGFSRPIDHNTNVVVTNIVQYIFKSDQENSLETVGLRIRRPPTTEVIVNTKYDDYRLNLPAIL